MIEWFLSPKSEQERSIQYAMQLYGLGKTSDSVIDRYLDADDKNLDRNLKKLQARKLASEQGLDWEDYTSDDAMDVNVGRPAVSYGMDLSRNAKQPWPALAGDDKSLIKRAIEVAKQGLGFQYDAQAHTVKGIGDLMKLPGKGIKVVRYL